MIRILKSPVHPRLVSLFVSLVLALFAATVLPAQGAGQTGAKADGDAPVFSEYRGVQIGMSADDTRKKLGRPKDKGEGADFFVFNDNESAQIVYDAAHKVATVSVDFSSGASSIPVAKAVVGTEVEAKTDGSLYKMVRYPKAGYWVSYSRTAGASPLISITIQKID